MAIQTSGIITLSDIQTEFGGSNPVSLSEYYAGGSYVPSGTSGSNGAVPTSGEIAVSDFYGTQSGITITVTEGSTTSYSNMGQQGVNYYGFGTRGYFPRVNSSGAEYTLNEDANNALWPQSMGSGAPTTAGFGTIRGLYYTPNKTSANRFYFVVNGTKAKSSFTSMDIEGYGTVTSASAVHGTFTNSSPTRTATFWRWDITPTGWNGTGTRTVSIS